MKDPKQPAQACVIWMHGLGADAQDMAGLADQLSVEVPIRHVFIDAPVRPVTLNNRMPMRAWYDIVGMKLTDREDREGIVQSEGLIREVIDTEIASGFAPERIFLAGFSQGGAMALYTGLQSTRPIAGIIALSAYLPLASECKIVMDKKTPLFAACGQFDPLVLPDWTKQGVTGLRERGFDRIEFHEYPMEHAICMDEVRDLSQWLTIAVESMGNCDRSVL